MSKSHAAISSLSGKQHKASEATVKPVPPPIEPPSAKGGRVCIDIPPLSLAGVNQYSFVPAKAEVKLSANRDVQNWVKHLSLSLEAHEATLQNGKPVKGCPQAIMWVLEQLACK